MLQPEKGSPRPGYVSDGRKQGVVNGLEGRYTTWGVDLNTQDACSCCQHHAVSSTTLTTQLHAATDTPHGSAAYAGS